MSPNERRNQLVYSCVAVATLLAATQEAPAQTWIGGGGLDGKWSNAANWTALPRSSDTTSIVMSGTHRLMITNQDIRDPFVLNKLTFDNTAGPFFIQGSKLEFAGREPTLIQNSRNLQTIQVPINLAEALSTGGSGSGEVRTTGVISGDLGLTKDGSYTLTLAGAQANTYTGVTTVKGGTLALDKDRGNAIRSPEIVIGDGAGTDTVRILRSNQIFDSATVTVSKGGGKLELAMGSDETIGILKGGGDVVLSRPPGTLTSSTLSTDGAGRPGQEIPEGDKFSGVISGGGNLTKIGDGILALSGKNTYTGDTTVQAGTLRVEKDGAIGQPTSRTGKLTVKGGARVDGQGEVFSRPDVRATWERNSTLKAGKSPGVFTIDGGGVELEPGAFFEVDLNGSLPGDFPSSHSQLIVNGEVLLDGSILVASLGYVPAPSDLLFLIKNDGVDPIVGTFDGLPEGSPVSLLSSGPFGDGNLYQFLISYLGNAELSLPSGGNDVVLTNAQVVPEPSTLVLLGTGALTLLGYGWRRRRPAT